MVAGVVAAAVVAGVVGALRWPRVVAGATRRAATRAGASPRAADRGRRGVALRTCRGGRRGSCGGSSWSGPQGWPRWRPPWAVGRGGEDGRAIAAAATPPSAERTATEATSGVRRFMPTPSDSGRPSARQARGKALAKPAPVRGRGVDQRSPGESNRLTPRALSRRRRRRGRRPRPRPLLSSPARSRRRSTESASTVGVGGRVGVSAVGTRRARRRGGRCAVRRGVAPSGVGDGVGVSSRRREAAARASAAPTRARRSGGQRARRGRQRGREDEPGDGGDGDREVAAPAGHAAPGRRSRGRPRSRDLVRASCRRPSGSRIVATAPPAGAVRQRHGAVPARGELAGDREPEPGAAAPRGAADGAAVEAGEDRLLLARRQARALVGDLEPAGRDDAP